MTVYLLIDLFVVFFAMLFGGPFSLNCKYSGFENKQSNILYYGLIASLLFFVSAFRGPITTDYSNYAHMFHHFSDMTIENILNRNWFDYPEKGYLLFQRVCSFLINDPISIFIVTSFVIVFANIAEIKKFFPFGFLPILLFVEMGVYYSSFNLVRQMLAVSIVVLGSKYLYNRKPIGFFLTLLVASTIHKSSLIVAPFYFLANKKMKGYFFIVYGLLFILGYFILPNILSFAQQFYWSWYKEGEYGMTGYSFNNMVAPLFMVVLPTIIRLCKDYNLCEDTLFYETEQEKNVITVWENGAFIFLFFSFLGTKLMMMQRFSSFFSIYAIFYFCHIVQSRLVNKQPIIFAMILVLVAYGFFTKVNNTYNPFVFIWE